MNCRVRKFYEVGRTSYFISDSGEVYSSRTVSAGCSSSLCYYDMDAARFFQDFHPIASFNGKGYRRVRIQGKNFKVYRLVAMSFVRNDDNLPHVLHKDGNRSNNHYKNLVWSASQSNRL